MNTLRVTLLFACLLFAALLQAKTLTIGIDMSESNPVVVSEDAAKAAGTYVYQQIAALGLGDFVRIRHFGSRDAKNMLGDQLQLTRRTRPQAVASALAKHIAELPSKSTQRDNQSNILSFLEFGSGFDCANGGRIVLLTDGIEASKTISDKSFLSGKRLPPPEPGLLKGCEVVMIPIGASKDGSIPPHITKLLRSAWAEWMKAAGATFNPITDL